MNSLRIEPQWIWIGAAAGAIAVGGTLGLRTYRRRSRRRALLTRLEKIALQAVHQVQVPDGMGGFFHVDHMLLTPRGVLILDTRRVAGLIFGGDQMSDWTVMARNYRYTFDNPQPALYDRIAAVKALSGDVPVEGRLLFSNLGKFTKGKPKYVVMLDGLEVEFPEIPPGQRPAQSTPKLEEAWRRLVAQLRPSPHAFTNL